MTSEHSGRPIGRLRPTSIGRVAGPAVAAVLLLVMVAAASRARVGAGPSPGSAVERVAFDALEPLTVAVLPAGVALLVAGLPRLRRRRRDRDEPEWVVERPPVPWYAKLLVVLLVLALLGGLAGTLVALRDRSQEPPVAPAVPTAPPPTRATGPAGTAVTTPRPSAPSPHPAVWALVAAAATAAAGGAVWWARSRRPAERLEPMRAGAERVLEEALRAGVEDLRREPDPRRAIVAAYARMLAVLGRLGFRHRAAETPLEYLRRVLGGLDGDPAPVWRLTDLFEVAAFSRRPVTEAMREEALQALGALGDRLGVAP